MPVWLRLELIYWAEVISVDVFDDLARAGRVDSHRVWESVQTRCR